MFLKLMNVCLIFKNFKKVKNTHDVISKGIYNLKLTF